MHRMISGLKFADQCVRLVVSGCFFILIILFGSSVVAAWVGVGPQWKVIDAISVAPDNAQVRYAGAFGSGVYKSSDGGVTWKAGNVGMTNTYVRSVLAVSSLNVFAGTNDGIFRSLDGGATWSSVLPTLVSIRALGRDNITGRMYAGTFGDGVYISTGGGASGTWSLSPVRDDTSGVELKHVRSVAVFGRDSAYAGGSIGDIPSGGALFVTLNGGTSWNQVQRGTGIRSTVMGIAISPNNPEASLIIGTAGRGVYKNNANGVFGVWEAINGVGTTHPLPDSNTTCVLFTQGYRMTALDVGGFFRRALGDVNQGWPVSTGLPAMPALVNTGWSDGAGVEVLVGTAGEGVYRSTDSGATFGARNTGMLGTAVRDIVFGNTGRLIAATGFGDGIWYSDNVGSSWIQASVPTSNSIEDLDRTSTPGTLYAGAYATGVLKSIDNGQTWVLTDTTGMNTFVRRIAVVPGSATVVYAGTGNGVFKTTNGGTSWSNMNGASIPFSTSMRSLEVSPSATSTVLAGTDVDYLYRSTNGGTNWTHVATAAGFHANDAFIRTIDFDPTTSGRVYAGCDSGHVYASSDNGATWSPLTSLLTTHSVRAIRIDPASSTRLFAATFGGGVFVSGDGGSSWSNISGNLPDSELYSLELDPAGPAANIYLGTGQTGLFKGSYNPNCTCPCHHDPQCDGVTDVLDVVKTIGVAFRGSPAVTDPGCPRQQTDLDCNGVTDVLDVVRMIGVAFRGADPATTICNPCA
ncbi:MAG: hypothetical protein HY304_08085 [candidate division Zixibacteria bacterium]|nr:hypothetical protein [candidate division Zixibacteria bacterium]